MIIKNTPMPKIAYCRQSSGIPKNGMMVRRIPKINTRVSFDKIN
jgi:hypothetical protein